MKIHSLAFSVLLCTSQAAQAELILSGSPSIQDRSELNKRYTELASELSQALGEPVRYVAPLNEMGYAQEIRKGSYDILLDGPHLAAWRHAKGIHQLVAQTNIPLTFLVVTPANDSSMTSTEQLIGKPVCAQASPHLSNLMFMSLYPNPLQLPNMRMVEGFKPIAEKVIKGECKAGVLSAAFYEKSLDQETRDKLRIIHNTRPLPGHIMTVSNKISPERREALTKRIINADPAHDTLVQAMTNAGVRGGEPSKTRWLAVKPESLKGLDEILVQQSFGWQ